MWSTEDAIKNLREFYDLTQQEMAERLGISKSYISLIESKKKKPSSNILRQISDEFSVNFSYLQTGKGKPFEDPKKSREFIVQVRRPKQQKVLLAASAITAPIIPILSAGLALGVAADAIIWKMQKAYGAKDATDLAKNKLGVDRSTITRWINKNHVPEKYIKQTADDTGQPEGYLKLNDALVDDLIESLATFTEEQMHFFEGKKFDRNVFRENFLKKYGLTEW
ncbi:MAG: hypothetical protein C0622_03220 [Desulfuromonas sp.]|nr:MAG: hypothetical protein C0622_03220 [Desulfuromonas sp.]